MVVGVISNSTAGTISVADGGDTFTSIVSNSITGGLVNIFRALNISSGKTSLTVTFTGGTNDKTAVVGAEFNNCATSSADDGHIVGSNGSAVTTISAASSGTGIFAGSGTTGDLIVQVGYRVGTPFVNATPPYTVGSQSNITWSTLASDGMDGSFSQWGVYNSTSSLSPQFTTGSSSTYVTAAIALKAASAGNGIPSGMQVVSIQHASINSNHSGTTPIELQVPCISGGMIVAKVGPGGNSYKVTGITDANSNTWTDPHGGTIAGDGTSGKSQTFYAYNMTCSGGSDDAVHVATSGGGSDDATILFYTVQGEATSVNPYRGGFLGYDNAAGLSCGVTGCTGTPVFSCDPVIDQVGCTTAKNTTGASDGISFSQMSVAFNTCESMTTGVFNSIVANGLAVSGPQPVDQNNCWGYQKFSSHALQQWDWQFIYDGSHNTGGYSSISDFFISATGTQLPYIVQYGVCFTASTSTTLACSTTATPKTGNALIALVNNNNSRTVSKVCTDGGTCGAGNSFTHATGAPGSSSTLRSDGWYLLSAPASAGTWTATFNLTATNREMFWYEVNCGSTPCSFDTDGHVTSGTGSSGTLNGPSLTTTDTDGFIATDYAVANTVDQNPLTGNEFVGGGAIQATTTDAANSLVSIGGTSHQSKAHDSSASDTFCASSVAIKK